MPSSATRAASTTAWIVIGGIALVLLLLAIVVIIAQRPTDCGTDKACFTRLALSCDSAMLTLSDDRGTAGLATKGCVVTKTLASLENAVPELEAEVVGQSMRCPYDKGSFPIGLLDSITSGTAICDGPLVERLSALARFSE